MRRPPLPCFDPEAFRSRLRQVREAAGLSANALSELIGASRAMVGNMEKADVDNPSGDVVTALSIVLGIKTDWLLKGEGELPSDEQIRAAVARAQESQHHLAATGS